MKRLELTPVEVRTLRDMGIFHSHPRAGCGRKQLCG